MPERNNPLRPISSDGKTSATRIADTSSVTFNHSQNVLSLRYRCRRSRRRLPRPSRSRRMAPLPRRCRGHGQSLLQGRIRTQDDQEGGFAYPVAQRADHHQGQSPQGPPDDYAAEPP